jgi:hypothetical protein
MRGRGRLQLNAPRSFALCHVPVQSPPFIVQEGGLHKEVGFSKVEWVYHLTKLF